MRAIYGNDSSLFDINGYSNQFNRVFVRDGLSYETEPMVTGYFFLSFSLPDGLSDPGEDYSQIDYSDANTLLNAVNTSISLPDVSISQVTIDGLGGTWNTVPGRLDVGKTFNVKFWETFSGEIISTHRSWVFQLRDPRTGAARIQKHGSAQGTSTDYNQENYKGQLWWWMTDPSIDRVIFSMEFLGIWPTNLPLSSVSQDVTSNDKVEIEITYAYDRPFFYPQTGKFTSGSDFLKARYSQMLDIESDVGDSVKNTIATG